MFLGLSPGSPGNSAPEKDDKIEDVRKNCFKPMVTEGKSTQAITSKKLNTNFRNVMEKMIGKGAKDYSYVKANAVHGYGKKDSVEGLVDFCGGKISRRDD